MSEKVTFGESLLEEKNQAFRIEAITRFAEFDRLMNLSNPDGNYHHIGYPTIVANLQGEYLHREAEQERKKAETADALSKLSGVLGGFQ